MIFQKQGTEMKRDENKYFFESSLIPDDIMDEATKFS